MCVHNIGNTIQKRIRTYKTLYFITARLYNIPNIPIIKLKKNILFILLYTVTIFRILKLFLKYNLVYIKKKKKQNNKKTIDTNIIVLSNYRL